MRAGHRRVFDDRHRCVGVADRDIRKGAFFQQLGGLRSALVALGFGIAAEEVISTDPGNGDCAKSEHH